MLQSCLMQYLWNSSKAGAPESLRTIILGALPTLIDNLPGLNQHRLNLFSELRI